MFSGSKRSQQFSKQIQIYVAGSVFDGTVLVELVIMLDQVRYHFGQRYRPSSGLSGIHPIGC